MRLFAVSNALGIVTLGAAGVNPKYLAEIHDRPYERRGIAFNRPEYVKHFWYKDSLVNWHYDWDSFDADTGSNSEFVPMLHSDKSTHTDPWLERVNTSANIIIENPTHILGFNEPDMCANGAGSSCMPVDAAVKAWKKFMEPTKQFKEYMYLGSPAVTNSNRAGEGLDWLKDFMEKCDDCHVDIMCIHWYGQATDVKYFKDHINEVRKFAGGRPIWVTEFFAKGTDNEVKEFFTQVLPWMDASDDIRRYAYFMAAPGLLLNADGTGRSELGTLYNYNYTKVHPATTPGPDRRPLDPIFKRASENQTVKRADDADRIDATKTTPIAGDGDSGDANSADEKGHAVVPGEVPSSESCWESDGNTNKWTPVNCPSILGEIFENEKIDMASGKKAKKCRFCPRGVCYEYPCSQETQIEERDAVPDPAFTLRDWPADCVCCLYNRCRRCVQCRPGGPGFTAPTAPPYPNKRLAQPDVEDSVIPTAAMKDELEVKGCRFVLWGWLCDGAIDSSAAFTATTSESTSQGCRFVLWGWVCDKQMKTDQAAKREAQPMVDDSVIPTTSTQDELEAKGCRFVLWGWICDTTVDASALSTAASSELASQGCRFLPWGWICDKQITSNKRPTIDTSVVSKATQDALQANCCRFVLWVGSATRCSPWKPPLCPKKHMTSLSATTATTSLMVGLAAIPKPRCL